jgi:hypothetical protein
MFQKGETQQVNMGEVHLGNDCALGNANSNEVMLCRMDTTGADSVDYAAIIF